MAQNGIAPSRIVDCLAQWLTAYACGVALAHVCGFSPRNKTPVDHVRDVLVMGLFLVTSLMWSEAAHPVPDLLRAEQRSRVRRACGAVAARALYIAAVVTVSLAFSCIKFVPGTDWTMQDVVAVRPHGYGLAEELMMAVSMGFLIVGIAVTLREARRHKLLSRAAFFPGLGLVVIAAIRLVIDKGGDRVRCREPSVEDSLVDECHAEWHPHHYQIAWLLAMSVVVKTRLTTVVAIIAWGVFLHGVTVYNADVLV